MSYKLVTVIDYTQAIGVYQNFLISRSFFGKHKNHALPLETHKPSPALPDPQIHTPQTT